MFIRIIKLLGYIFLKFHLDKNSKHGYTEYHLLKKKKEDYF